MAYVWQAQAISHGYLTLPSPALPKSFLVPFVVDYNGQRFGKYPLGWPVVLALGERLGVPYLVNPLLAGLGVWLTYQLGKRLFGATGGLLAAGLTVTSPFFLMNSGSLLTHPLGLVLTSVFALGWLDAFHTPGISKRWLPALAAGAALGLLALTRPLTAVCVGLPFAVHGLILLVRGDWTTRRNLILFGVHRPGDQPAAVCLAVRGHRRPAAQPVHAVVELRQDRFRSRARAFTGRSHPGSGLDQHPVQYLRRQARSFRLGVLFLDFPALWAAGHLARPQLARSAAGRHLRQSLLHLHGLLDRRLAVWSALLL